MAAGARRIALLARLEEPAAGFAVSCLLATVAVCTLVGPSVLLHPGGAVVGRNPSSDYQIMTWSLAWWPWAAAHGVDPLYTHLLWAPGGFSTLWMTTIPAASLVGLPLTLTAGPLVAFNVLMIAAVVLASGAGYLLCHELTGRFDASLAGGFVFGLSPYVLGHAVSQHLNLTLVFPVPLVVRLVVRYVRGRTSARRLAGGSALLLLFLLASSLELFVDFTLLSALGFAAAIAGGGSQRRTYVRAAALVMTAYAACLPVLVPLGVLALSEPHAPLRSSPSDYASDLLNVVVPTSTLLLGKVHAARTVSQHFVGNIGERDAYLGVPLLAVCVAAVRLAWRRGAWIAGVVLLGALLLSFGPILTVGGRPIVRLPFSVAGLPVLRDALPVRLSLFTALAAACLCAIWFAQPRRRGVRPLVGAVIAVSLMPNFWTGAPVPGAWAVSNALSWSTPHVGRGVVAGAWRTRIPPGSNVLVLPTGDRTPASYWQAATGMGFTLAVPATPFVPPQLAANPTIALLADDVLPQLDGATLGGARLRSFLLARHIRTVVVARSRRRRWSRLVRRATGKSGIQIGGDIVFDVSPSLPSLTGTGAVATAHDGGDLATTWLTFDGRLAHAYARVWNGRVMTTRRLSSVAGDAGSTSVAINLHGQAAFAFTEWQRNRVLLRVATYAGSHWRVATLDRRSEPIWSPRVVVTPNGGTVAAWIDDAAPLRRVRVAALVGNSWHEAITLDAADGLGSVAGAPGIDNRVVFAWHDSLANEERVRAIVYAGGSWSRPVTLAAGVERLGRVFVGSQAAFVRWRRDRGSARTAERVESIRHAGAWGRAWVVRLDRTKSPDRPRAAIRP